MYASGSVGSHLNGLPQGCFRAGKLLLRAQHQAELSLGSGVARILTNGFFQVSLRFREITGTESAGAFLVFFARGLGRLFIGQGGGSRRPVGPMCAAGRGKEHVDEISVGPQRTGSPPAEKSGIPQP